jgi:hypothetical protein
MNAFEMKYATGAHSVVIEGENYPMGARPIWLLAITVDGKLRDGAIPSADPLRDGPRMMRRTLTELGSV